MYACRLLEVSFDAPSEALDLLSHAPRPWRLLYAAHEQRAGVHGKIIVTAQCVVAFLGERLFDEGLPRFAFRVLDFYSGHRTWLDSLHVAGSRTLATPK